ncbi:Smg-4/UPF3 family-domain-containing protein [Gongronella butleri]|nr:Smg-4/UPF3 family-domain-containing protein [Gongronella butleri]
MSAPSSHTDANKADTPASKDDRKSAADPQKKKKKRERRRKKAKSSAKEAIKTKVIVRRLPPNLPEDVFMNAVSRWTGDDIVDYKVYIPGKVSQSKGKENTFSRAYFHMKTMDAVIAFHQGFDGHIFMDSKGNENRAVVEFAPYQGVPKEPKAPDARQGTIEEDPDYIKFLEILKEEQEKPADTDAQGEGTTPLERLENRLASLTAQSHAQEQASKPKTTPLLDHLRALKAAKAETKAKKKAASKSKKAKQQETSASKSPAANANANANAAPAEKAKRRRPKKKNTKDASNQGSATPSPAPGASNASSPAPAQQKPPRQPRQPRQKPNSVSNDANANSNANANASGSNAKPKRTRNRKPKAGGGGGGDKQAAPPVMKILGRDNA